MSAPEGCAPEARAITTLEEYWSWLEAKDRQTWDHVALGAPAGAQEFVTIPLAMRQDPRFLDHQSGDWLGELDVATGAYELVHQVAAGDVVMDVGAHVGHFTRHAAGKAATVYAVEANPRNARKIVGLGLPNVQVLQVAAWSESGRPLQFDLSVSSVLGAVSVVSAEGRAIEGKIGEVTVLSVALDDLLLPRLDFLKLDVEGAEAHVLRGARETLKRCRPFVVLETHGYAGVNAECLATLAECGYRFVGAQSLMNDPQLSPEPVGVGIWHCEPV